MSLQTNVIVIDIKEIHLKTVYKTILYYIQVIEIPTNKGANSYKLVQIVNTHIYMSENNV